MGERPVRVQLRRTKGWRMPLNTLKVDRSTRWGNPFVVGKPGGAYTALVKNRRHAWQLYNSVARFNEPLILAAQTELRGKNLACWCPLPTEPYELDCCHAAVLLELAATPSRDHPHTDGDRSGRMTDAPTAERLVTVCDACLQASCWQGIFMCWESESAGTIEMPLSKLQKLALEHPRFWEPAQ